MTIKVLNVPCLLSKIVKRLVSPALYLLLTNPFVPKSICFSFVLPNHMETGPVNRCAIINNNLHLFLINYQHLLDILGDDNSQHL